MPVNQRNNLREQHNHFRTTNSTKAVGADKDLLGVPVADVIQ
jgi:hypothetical protein